MSRKKKQEDSIESGLDQWAVRLMNRISDANASSDAKLAPTIAEETGAFKAVTLYFAYKMKLSPPPKVDEGTFDGHADTVANTGRGTRRSQSNGSATAESEF